MYLVLLKILMSKRNDQKKMNNLLSALFLQVASVNKPRWEMGIILLICKHTRQLCLVGLLCKLEGPPFSHQLFAASIHPHLPTMQCTTGTKLEQGFWTRMHFMQTGIKLTIRCGSHGCKVRGIQACRGNKLEMCCKIPRWCSSCFAYQRHAQKISFEVWVVDVWSQALLCKAWTNINGMRSKLQGCVTSMWQILSKKTF